MYMVNYDGNDRKKAIEISIEDYNDVIVGLRALIKFNNLYTDILNRSWTSEIGCISPTDLLREFTAACMFNENIITDREINCHEKISEY